MAVLPPLASVDDLAGWIGEPISEDADVTRAGWALRAASGLVRAETGRYWVDPDADPAELLPILPDVLVTVTLACAARQYTNPEALMQEGVDDWQSQRKVEESGAYLTASEKDSLATLNRPRHGGLSTVATTRGDAGEPNPKPWIINGPDARTNSTWW